MSSTGGGVIVVKHNAITVSGSATELQAIANSLDDTMPELKTAIQEAVDSSDEE